MAARTPLGETSESAEHLAVGVGVEGDHLVQGQEEPFDLGVVPLGASGDAGHRLRRRSKAPVVFELDGDDIVTSGFDIAKTVRYRNVRKNPRATLVIDDLASTDPWSPRGVKIIGSCTVESHGLGERFRIYPEVIISLGVNDTTPGIPTMERREVG